MSKTDHLYAILCKDNPSALSFLQAWNTYCHAVDDVIDTVPDPSPEKILHLCYAAACVYSHPFWLTHGAKLLPTVCLITSAYADSVKMEHSGVAWQQTWADTLRFCGNQMVEAVALIVSGYEHVRSHSMALREAAWKEHHDAAGKPQ